MLIMLIYFIICPYFYSMGTGNFKINSNVNENGTQKWTQKTPYCNASQDTLNYVLGCFLGSVNYYQVLVEKQGLFTIVVRCESLFYDWTND